MTKTNLKKIALATMIGLGALSAQAQTINGDLNGTVLPGCTITNTGALAFNMNVTAGRVGTSQADINLLCSNTLPYTIRAVSTQVQVVSSASETINIRAFSDSARTAQITTAAGISATGNGAVQTHTVYLRAESLTGPDLGQGRVLTRDGTFTGTFNFVLAF